MTRSLVVFDLDGVLVDSWPAMRLALDAAWLDCGAPPPVGYERFREELGRPLPEIARALDLPPSFVRAYESASAGLAHLVLPYDGVEATLHSLRQRGHAIALNTGKSRERTDHLLARLQWGRWFDAVVTGSDGLPGKPSADTLNFLASRLKTHPRDVAFVGDGVTDLLCARAAGTRSIAAMWGMGERAALKALRPDAIADAITDVPGLIDQLRVIRGRNDAYV